MGKLCHGKHVYEVTTVMEALKASETQLRSKLQRLNGKRWLCVVKDHETDSDLNSTPKSNELHVFPSFSPSGGGSKSSAWIQIAIGAAIAVTAFLTGGASFAAMGALSTAFFGIGVSLVLGGLQQLLMRYPKSDTGENEENSKYFGSNQNTTAIGTRIPIGYGKYRVYGQILSLNLKATDR